ncbi:MAG: hypothetical protein ABI675_25630 [Chitinophagaceae bacterium]
MKQERIIQEIKKLEDRFPVKGTFVLSETSNSFPENPDSVCIMIRGFNAVEVSCQTDKGVIAVVFASLLKVAKGNIITGAKEAVTIIYPFPFHDNSGFLYFLGSALKDEAKTFKISSDFKLLNLSAEEYKKLLLETTYIGI